MVSFRKYITSVCLVIVFVCVPITVGTRRQCNTEQYWHTLFVRCMPCNEICKPLNRSVCLSQCADYVRSLTACSNEQYWDTLYGKCINCAVICDPISRDACKEKCGDDYIESLRTLNAETSTAPDPTTDTTMTAGRWISDRDAIIVLITTLVIIIFVISYCYRSKIAKCVRNCFIRRPEKMPIPETCCLDP